MRAMRMLFVLVVAILALAVPMTAQAFTGPPNPAVPQGDAASATTTVGWSGRDVGLAIVFGATTVLIGVGARRAVAAARSRPPADTDHGVS